MTMTSAATAAATLAKPIYLQNEQAGPVVFGEIVWEGKGSNTGLDCQAVSANFLNDTNFLRILSRGILTLVEADAETTALVEDALQSPALRRQASLFKDAQEEKVDAIHPLERTEANDFLPVGCIGPGTRPGLTCGVAVPIKQSQAGEVAPLCATHASLAPLAVPTETDEIKDGKPVYVWSIASINR